MPVQNAHWYNANESRAYPLDDKASALSDTGELLPANIITDLRLRWPRLAGELAFVSAVTITPGAVSVVIQAADTLDNLDQAFTPLAALSVPIADLEEGRQYLLKALYPQTMGYLTFGSGVQAAFAGRFRTPQQTLLAPRAARFHRGLPVTSMGRLASADALTGVVRLLGSAPLEVVKESREIDGIERDVIVVRLVGDVATTDPTDNVFARFSGPCAKRPESGTCGPPEPIEFVNSVSPDCDGVLCLDFRGVITVGRSQNDCGVVLDTPFGLSNACVPPYLPDHQGRLPFEVDPINQEPPVDPEPPVEPLDSVSDSIILLGELPYCDPFDNGGAAGFVVKEGQWAFVDDDSPEEICGLEEIQYQVSTDSYSCGDDSVCQSPDSTSLSTVRPQVSYASEGLYSAAVRNVVVWEGFDVTTLHRRVTTDIKFMPGPDGAKHNGGLVVNFRESSTPESSAFVYYIAELDYEAQAFRIRRWNGSVFQPVISVSTPGIELESWYRIIVEVQPGLNDKVYITAKLQGITSPDLSVVLGPLMTNNYRPDDGWFGFGSDRAYTRFSFFLIEELM